MAGMSGGLGTFIVEGTSSTGQEQASHASHGTSLERRGRARRALGRPRRLRWPQQEPWFGLGRLREAGGPARRGRLHRAGHPRPDLRPGARQGGLQGDLPEARQPGARRPGPVRRPARHADRIRRVRPHLPEGHPDPRRPADPDRPQGQAAAEERDRPRAGASKRPAGHHDDPGELGQVRGEDAVRPRQGRGPAGVRRAARVLPEPRDLLQGHAGDLQDQLQGHQVDPQCLGQAPGPARQPDPGQPVLLDRRRHRETTRSSSRPTMSFRSPATTSSARRAATSSPPWTRSAPRSPPTASPR